MFLKTVKFFVYTTKIPANIKIYLLDGEVILNKTLNKNQSIICVCCCKGKIAINLKYKNQSKTQYFVITNCKYQFFSVYFNFNNFLTPQTIFLLDKNYNLPINSAILTFKQKNPNF